MYRLLPLLGDVGIGILAIAFLSFCYGEDFHRSLWFLPLIFLPDLDALPELLERGNVGASRNCIRDHRERLHVPLLFLVPAGLLSYHVGYEGMVVFTLFYLHFLHDSILTGWGVPWFAPFSDVRVKFFASEQNNASLRRRDWVRVWKRTRLPYLIEKFGDEDWIRNHYLRITPTSVIEYSTFIAGIVVLLRLSG